MSKDLADKIPQVNKHFTYHLKGALFNLIFLSPVTPEEVEMSITLMKSKKVVGMIELILFSNSFESMQKKAIRCIAGVSTYAHTGNLFSQYKILNLGYIYTLHLGEFMYSQIYNVGPTIGLFRYEKKITMSTYTTHVKLNKCIIYITVRTSKLLTFSTLCQNIRTWYPMM